MDSVARRLLLGCLMAVAVVPWARSETSSPSRLAVDLPPGLRLVWFDSEELLPFGLERLSAELTTLAGAMGVDMALEPAHQGDEASPRRYRVEVMRAPKVHWRLRADVMAAAPRAEGYQGTIYVFLEQVRRTLGHLASPDPSEEPREHAELALALARILTHEIVHVVAPDHPHSASGLMVAKLRRGPLLKRKARIDPACTRAFRRALVAN